MKITAEKFKRILISEINLKYESDTPEYINELDTLIDSMKSLKNSLGKGSDRLKHRKERYRLQSAIEAVRFLRNKSQRKLNKRLISEGGKKIEHLPDSQKASLSPEVVTQAVTLYRDLMTKFNSYLSSVGMREVYPDKPVGSTYYYQEDLEQGSDVIYGDIDYLVILPPPEDSSELRNVRIDQAKIERDYTRAFLDFIKSSAPNYVDVKLTGDVSPTMVVVSLEDGKKIQIDLIATIPRYQDWMLTRWVPEKGVKGYIGGNLYKALGDSLLLTIGDQGVLARVKDGKRVSSKNRGKDVKFIQVSSDPKSFFKDIVSYMIGNDSLISQDLEQFPGMNPDNILISDIAKGIRRISENLDSAGYLPDRFSNGEEMLEEVLARFKLALDETIRKKSKPSSSGGVPSEEKIGKLIKMNSEQYNNVKNEFNL